LNAQAFYMVGDIEAARKKGEGKEMQRKFVRNTCTNSAQAFSHPLTNKREDVWDVF